jgi:hypothetical protein
LSNSSSRCSNTVSSLETCCCVIGVEVSFMLVGGSKSDQPRRRWVTADILEKQTVHGRCHRPSDCNGAKVGVRHGFGRAVWARIALSAASILING